MEIMENIMYCQKCDGKMIHERFYDYLDETGRYSFIGWRCLVCGDIVDPVILGNRKSKTHQKPKATRKRRYTVV